jgi:hypothetical protein
MCFLRDRFIRTLSLEIVPGVVEIHQTLVVVFILAGGNFLEFLAFFTLFALFLAYCPPGGRLRLKNASQA